MRWGLGLCVPNYIASFSTWPIPGPRVWVSDSPFIQRSWTLHDYLFLLSVFVRTFFPDPDLLLSCSLITAIVPLILCCSLTVVAEGLNNSVAAFTRHKLSVGCGK